MKPSIQVIKRALLFSVLVLLAACNQEGIAGFSPNNNRVAVVHKVASDIRLYTTDNNGGGPVKIEDNIIPGFDVTFDPLGQKLLYAAGGQICTSDVVGGGKACPVNLPAGVSGGFLAFLPSGDYIFVYSSGGTTNPLLPW